MHYSDTIIMKCNTFFLLLCVWLDRTMHTHIHYIVTFMLLLAGSCDPEGMENGWMDISRTFISISPRF